MSKIKNQAEKITKESKGFIKEFKEFIARGNVMDLAVGVIIGGAFSKIVTAFTTVLTDLISVAIGGVNFSDLAFPIKDVSIKYGEFLQATFDFLVTAFCIFILIKLVNKLMRKKKEEKVVEPAPAKKPDDIILLEEIRDLLKENKKQKKNK